LIGYFANTLVLRTDLSGDPSFVELLKRVREVALAAYAHQDLPFEKLVEELQPERRWSHMPIFQIAFVMQNAAEPVTQIGDLQLTPAGVETGVTKCDLVMIWTETNGELRGQINYTTELFSRERMAQMARHYVNLLESVVNDPGQKLQDVVFISDEELRLLEQWAAA
jgi:non-ribosomal peptide synthetase component F